MHKEIITPERAHELLELNVNNRKLSMLIAKRYASDMMTGRWRDVGDPLRFNHKRLYDGQHRLQAIILADVTIEMWVVNDVDDEDMAVIDSGKPRNLSDTLRWAGATNANDTAAVTRRLNALSWNLNLRNQHEVNSFTKSQLIEFYEAHEELITAAIVKGRMVSKAIGQSTSAWSLCFAHLSYRGADDYAIDKFCELLAGDGSNLGSGSPILALRNWSLKHDRGRTKLRPDELLIASIKAYNAFSTGTAMKVMRVSANEVVPRIAGT